MNDSTLELYDDLVIRETFRFLVLSATEAQLEIAGLQTCPGCGSPGSNPSSARYLLPDWDDLRSVAAVALKVR